MAPKGLVSNSEDDRRDKRAAPISNAFLFSDGKTFSLLSYLCCGSKNVQSNLL
jgi:hypothetical protein